MPTNLSITQASNRVKNDSGVRGRAFSETLAGRNLTNQRRTNRRIHPVSARTFGKMTGIVGCSTLSTTGKIIEIGQKHWLAFPRTP